MRSIAQRVCVMRAGEIVEQADCQSLFNAPQHPYSRLLLDAEPDADALCSDEREPVCIKTIWGKGYLFNPFAWEV